MVNTYFYFQLAESAFMVNIDMIWIKKEIYREAMKVIKPNENSSY
jgi:hypothetical protein